MKIIHIITGLSLGGAETQLERLITATHSYKAKHQVISLLPDKTPLYKLFLDNNIPVYSPHFSHANPLPGLYRLTNFFKKEAAEPHTIIQTWMYHGDFFGSLAVRFAGVKAPLIWNIRQTLFPTGLTGLLARANSYLSDSLPIAIVSCAHAAAENHISHGYAENKIQVIPNGYDTQLFSPNPAQRQTLRHTLRLEENIRLIGIIGRYHPIKGHAQLLEAIAKLEKKNVHFLFVGRGITDAPALQKWFSHPNVKNRVTVFPETSEIQNIMAGLDFLCMPSLSEGFPNVVAEAMSCGIPCIVTDVGDAARIVGKTGIVVSNAKPELLIDGIQTACEWTHAMWQNYSELARQQILASYSIEKMCAAYLELYDTILRR